MNYLDYIDRTRVKELEYFLNEMKERGLALHYNKPYQTDDQAMSDKIMYFPPLLLAPGDRKGIATYIVGSSDISQQDKVLNCCLSYFYGPTDIYHYVSGKADPKKAFIDFELVYKDKDYVESIRENIAYARSHGHKMWTTTELHTSIQTAARNYCRIKHNEPDRKSSDVDLLEWMAGFLYDGTVDKILSAKTLEKGYEAITSVRGIGPYFGYNSIMMIANMRDVEYHHEELFCAPGGGAVKTIEYLFEPLRKSGKKLNHGELIAYVAEHQDEIFEELLVPSEFKNLDVTYGKLLKNDQTRYTCNSFEVGMCQFSVYQRIKADPALGLKRPNPAPIDMSPFIQRDQGSPMQPILKKKDAKYQPTATHLLEF